MITSSFALIMYLELEQMIIERLNLSLAVLKRFLFIKKEKYLTIYFSMESLDDLFADSVSDDDGIYVDRDVWRKREIIMLNAPLLVAAAGAGKFYSLDFCSEYIEAGQVRVKAEAFHRLIEEILAYSHEQEG